MVQHPQPLASTTGYSEQVHRGLDGFHDGLLGHDHAIDDDIFRPVEVERLVRHEAGEADCPVAQIFGHDAADKHILDDDWFYECEAHVFPPKPFACEARGNRTATAIAHLKEITAICEDGNAFINACNLASITAGCERLPQVAQHSPCDGIWQHQSVHDSVFFAVRDPGNKPDFTIDALDIDASREGVFDNYGFRQRRIGFFLGHSPTHVASQSRLQRANDSWRGKI